MPDKSELKAVLPANQELLNKIRAQPQFCECARVASRPLNSGQLPTLDRIGKAFSFLDSLNLKPSHEHIIWGASQDNLGFMGQDGGLGLFPLPPAEGALFSEQIVSQVYDFENSECLDGSIVRLAALQVGIPKQYRMFGFNCQDYIDAVRDRYRQLKQKISTIF